MEIKQILKELRSDNGLTQKAIAIILNISETGYASWEQGLSEPNVEMLRKICLHYKISADYLLGLEDEYGNKVKE